MHDCNDGNVCVCMHTHTSCMDIIDMMTCMNDRMTVMHSDAQIAPTFAIGAPSGWLLCLLM